MWGKMREDLQSGSFFKPGTISDINAQVSKIDGFSKKSKLDIQLQELEEELRKIDAFKRELPLCMHLLKEAIERLTEEGLQWKGEKVGAVMEEFIPMKSHLEERQEAKISNDWSEKKDWMSSFQLWSNPIQFESKFDTRNQESDLHPKSSCQENEVLCNLKNRVGDSVSFNKPVNEEKGFIPVRGHSPSIPIVKVGSKLQKRKQRRCWSPELHKSFVNALHQLGGEQATPKQIRELMKVDGLTNDEIKSHLQKYRLHIRKLSTSSTSPSNCSWLTKDRYGDFSKENDVSYGSPQFPMHLGGSLKGESITRRDCMKEEEEDEKLKFHSSKGRVQNTVRDVYRQLHPGFCTYEHTGADLDNLN